MRAWISIVATALLVSGLLGCATPHPVLDEANYSAALVGSLEGHLREFRRVQAGIASGRIESIRRQRTLLEAYKSEAAFDERIDRVVGDAKMLRVYDNLKHVVEGRAKDQAAMQTSLADLDSMLAKLVSPLPETGKALSTVQEALAALGAELSTKEQIELFVAFATEVRAGIDKNKNSIAAAEAAVPSASVQSPPKP